MQQRMKQLAVVLVAAWLATMPAMAAKRERDAVRRQTESSLGVTGTITVNPDGTVLTHTLDPKAPLSADLVGFIDKTVASWRFKPIVVDGKAVTAKVPMHLRLVAKPTDGQQMTVTIASTYFGDDSALPATDTVRSRRLPPPSFPRDALMRGGKGTVYLIVEVDREGKVSNVDAEQVNLRVAGTANEMDALRRQFTDAAIRAARRWTFDIPTTGEQAGEDRWLARVPVEFLLGRPGNDRKREWDTYIPGPRNMAMPWAQEKLKTAGSPDALPEGGIYPLEQGATLLTPPVG